MDLAITAIETSAPPVAGKAFTYRFRFTNLGDATASNVVLYTTHDSGFEWLDDHVLRANGQEHPTAQIFSPGAPYNQLETHVPTLAPGESLTLSVKVRAPLAGAFSVSADLTPTAGDLNPSNNLTEARTVVSGPSGPLPVLETFGFSRSRSGPAVPSLAVRPGEQVFAFFELEEKAKKDVTVQFFPCRARAAPLRRRSSRRARRSRRTPAAARILFPSQCRFSQRVPLWKCALP